MLLSTWMEVEREDILFVTRLTKIQSITFTYPWRKRKRG